MGAALCSRLQEAGHTVVPVDSKSCDLTREDSLRAFQKHSFDLIFHLASWSRAGEFSLTHAGQQWIVNQKINTHMLDWWLKSQQQAKIICIGSSWGFDPALPMTEENYLKGEPVEQVASYAYTKRMLYVGLQALHKQFGLKYLFLIPDTLYGPHYHTDGRPMHFIFDLIRKIMRGKLYDEPVVLWGDGYQRREVVFREDFISFMIELTGRLENDIINVAPSQEYSIRQYAQMICERVGFDFNKIQFDTTRFTGASSKCLVADKLRRLKLKNTFTPLELGLTRTIEWFWQEKDILLSKT